MHTSAAGGPQPCPSMLTKFPSPSIWEDNFFLGNYERIASPACPCFCFARAPGVCVREARARERERMSVCAGVCVSCVCVLVMCVCVCATDWLLMSVATLEIGPGNKNPHYRSIGFVCVRSPIRQAGFSTSPPSPSPRSLLSSPPPPQSPLSPHNPVGKKWAGRILSNLSFVPISKKMHKKLLNQ